MTIITMGELKSSQTKQERNYFSNYVIVIEQLKLT